MNVGSEHVSFTHYNSTLVYGTYILYILTTTTILYYYYSYYYYYSLSDPLLLCSCVGTTAVL